MVKPPTKSYYVYKATRCHSLVYALLKKNALMSSGYCCSINPPLPHHNQLQAVCRCQCVNHSNVERVGIKEAELQKRDIQSACIYYEQYCTCTSCMSDSSHCPDSCTPCRCANCSANCPLPVCFTACTTVPQVRGKSPVPLSWPSHFSTSCNIRSPTFDLSA